MKSALLSAAIPAISRMEDGKLSLLVTRLAQSVVNGTEETPFTDEEMAKLEASLEMGKNDIELAVTGIFELISESAYDLATPSILKSKLMSLGLEANKSNVISNAWGKVMPAINEEMKKKSVLPQVSHVAYTLSVQAGSDMATAEKSVKAHLQLGLKSAVTAENLDLEFSHEELYDLHTNLSRIQAQLDAIADKKNNCL